ncbi:hypothetical protein [Pseudomonas rhodesiae]|uniref:Uncharacterized protein n=1 Tax=Pseudomonas rhodesiae TaxID=76760 RepID=A0AAE8HCH0_9PSED|nr:hypothetical protein [Pseudomonas rhodesiae]TWR55478.1 hypothetical protein FIV35_11960 [Pseudomonas rhodesiae]SDV06174.1 hypothetical protein SAMN04490209_2520 [Pseudomonas rhodesiae]
MRKKISKTPESGMAEEEIPIVLPAPIITGLVDPAQYEGLIYREYADQEELVVEIPMWSPVPTLASRPDTFTLYMDDTGNFQTGLVIHEPVHFPGVVPATYKTKIARRHLTEGSHKVTYKISQFSGNDSGSSASPLLVDRTAPYDSIPDGPRRLTLPPGWTGSLTQALLDANPGGVPFGIPAYASEGSHIADRWRLSFGDSTEILAEGPVFPDMVVRFTQALADVGDGPRKLVYRLVDVAGNISDPSFELPISVALRPEPVLNPPGVRDALSLTGVGDRLIDRFDTAASSGMFVIIPTYDADRAIDRLIVRLTTIHGARDVGPYPLGGAALPFSFHVDFTTLAALYGTSVGRINLRVEYAVDRAGTLHWVQTATNIDLELEVGGPVNPWEPDLINPNLPLPILTGRGSGLTNQLDERDSEMDADVVVRLWAGSPPPSAQPLDIVLKYMNDEVDRKTVGPNPMPGDEIFMVVPWPFIRKHSNNLIPLHYEIVISGTHNRAYSPHQDINVNANVISFLKPRVIGAIPEEPGIRGEIVCSTLQGPGREVHVFVPTHQDLQIGMIVTVNWIGCSDDDGTVPIPGATGTFPFGPLNYEQTKSGFTVAIRPYEDYVKPINQAALDHGSVHITYSVPILGAPTPITSAEAILWMRGVRPGPVYCDGTPWPSGTLGGL